MAFSFNGIGTSYYGQSDFEADGSYVTTKWFIVAFAPLIPVESIRVQDVSSGLFGGRQYAVVAQHPLHLIQVLKTWAYVVGCAVLFGAVLAAKINPMIQFTVIGAGVLLPHVLRWVAKRKASASPT